MSKDEFEVGKTYKLRPDYPIPENPRTLVTFEGRSCDWDYEMKRNIFDMKPRKCTDSSVNWIGFEGIGKHWKFNRKDFIETSKHNLKQIYQRIKDEKIKSRR